jgi:hypothetical protein
MDKTKIVAGAKQAGDKIIKGFMYILFAFVGLALIMQIAGAEPDPKPYQPLTPQAQITYDSAFKTLCEAEKGLAQAKLQDVANGVKMDVDLNALNQKRDKECGF